MQDQTSHEPVEDNDHWGLKPRQPGEPFSPDYLQGASCGGVEITCILYWYNGPIMFLAHDEGGTPYLAVQTDEDRDGRTSTYMAVRLTPEQHDAIKAAPDIETVNDMARACLRAGADVRLVTTRWEGPDHLVEETVLDLAQAESHVGDGHQEAPYTDARRQAAVP